MRLSLFKANRPPSNSAELADIDVTPIMNMFVILIPFLVSMAVFTHLSIIEFSLPPSAGAGVDMSAGKPKLKLTVRVGADYLGIILGEKLLDSVAVHDGVFPYDTLGSLLAQRRSETEIKDEIVVASLDDLAFQRVVTVMDLCRENGFSKIGLSSATSDSRGEVK